VAKYFLLKSDLRRYASLVATIQNDYISRQDKYPKTLSRAYDMIVNYVNPHKQGGETLECPTIRTMTNNMSKDMAQDKAYQVEDVVMGMGVEVVICMVSHNTNEIRMGMTMRTTINWNMGRNSNKTANNNSTNSHDYLCVSSPPSPVQPPQLDSTGTLEDTLQSTVTEPSMHISPLMS
jgi:hypothetical protein